MSLTRSTDDDGDPISTDFKVTVYPMPSLVDVLDISIQCKGDLYTVGASRGNWRQTSVRLLRDRSAERSAHRASIHRRPRALSLALPLLLKR